MTLYTNSVDQILSLFDVTFDKSLPNPDTVDQGMIMIPSPPRRIAFGESLDHPDSVQGFQFEKNYYIKHKICFEGRCITVWRKK